MTCWRISPRTAAKVHRAPLTQQFHAIAKRSFVMKRFHAHLHVDDLNKSIDFYSKLFGAEPSRVESDYAKWMLDDPRVNFAISTRGHQAAGLDHFGFQIDKTTE